MSHIKKQLVAISQHPEVQRQRILLQEIASHFDVVADSRGWRAKKGEMLILEKSWINNERKMQMLEEVHTKVSVQVGDTKIEIDSTDDKREKKEDIDSKNKPQLLTEDLPREWM